MIYRNTKTGAEIFSNSIMHAPGLVLVERADKVASVEDCHNTPLTAKEPPLKKEAPDKKEQPKKKFGTKKKGTKK